MASREGNEAVVRVRDTGIGMTPELIGRVFDKFVQGDERPKVSAGGLGIGLFSMRDDLARALGVEQHRERAEKGDAESQQPQRYAGGDRSEGPRAARRRQIPAAMAVQHLGAKQDRRHR